MILHILILSACTPVAPTAVRISPTATASPTQMLLPTEAALGTPTLIPTPVPDTLFLDPSLSPGPISSLIYGSNYGPWLAVSFPMLQAAYDSDITILRFPGGS